MDLVNIILSRVVSVPFSGSRCVMWVPSFYIGYDEYRLAVLSACPLGNSKDTLSWYGQQGSSHAHWNKLSLGSVLQGGFHCTLVLADWVDRVAGVWRSPSPTSPLTSAGSPLADGAWPSADGQATGWRFHQHLFGSDHQGTPGDNGWFLLTVLWCDREFALAYKTQHVRLLNVCQEPWVLWKSWLIHWTFSDSNA